MRNFENHIRDFPPGENEREAGANGKLLSISHRGTSIYLVYVNKGEDRAEDGSEKGPRDAEVRAVKVKAYRSIVS